MNVLFAWLSDLLTKDISALVETCPKIEVIQLSKSYMSMVSKSIEMFLEVQKTQLIGRSDLGVTGRI
jgi:hypothetical protein